MGIMYGRCNWWDNNQDFFFQIVTKYIQFQRDVLFTVKLSSENCLLVRASTYKEL